MMKLSELSLITLVIYKCWNGITYLVHGDIQGLIHTEISIIWVGTLIGSEASWMAEIAAGYDVTQTMGILYGKEMWNA